MDAWILENFPAVFVCYLVAMTAMYAGLGVAGIVARLRGDRTATEAIVVGGSVAVFCGVATWIVSWSL